jgi:hypothetical protein
MRKNWFRLSKKVSYFQYRCLKGLAVKSPITFMGRVRKQSKMEKYSELLSTVNLSNADDNDAV